MLLPHHPIYHSADRPPQTLKSRAIATEITKSPHSTHHLKRNRQSF
ncbi:hypothetical protein [Cylindrospermopsis raciborskii]|nr:hypothetical protein [Cylindrospermopsis raciborskii]MCZ2203223.1 hypothetical protein [Cylindrospermopsis raciborskii PAMP2012]